MWSPGVTCTGQVWPQGPHGKTHPASEAWCMRRMAGLSIRAAWWLHAVKHLVVERGSPSRSDAGPRVLELGTGRLSEWSIPSGATDPNSIRRRSRKCDERNIALELLASTRRQSTVTLIGDEGYSGRAFAQAARDMNATIPRPAARTSRAGTHSSRRSANASSRSSEVLSQSASYNASSRSPPPSPSTTNSDAQAARSSTTAPKTVESII
jgi:hypothetical protein